MKKTFKKKIAGVVESEITHLNNLCLDLINKRKECEILAEKLECLKKETTCLELNIIPEFAAQIGPYGIKALTLGNNQKMEIKEDLKTSISGVNLNKALGYIIEKKAEHLINSKITIDFTNPHDDNIKLLKNTLLNLDISFDSKSTVNAASLKAFVKKLRELGTSDLDDSGISIYDFKKTLIK